MRVLVACEFSGIVREAFRTRGHDAWSCDLLPTRIPGKHMVEDVRVLLPWGWDLLIAFPPCTHLSRAGARWWPAKIADGRQQEALDFVQLLANANVPQIAIENPVGKLSSAWRPPDQTIQPWMFGDPWVKTTCLWLKALPRLLPTQQVTPKGYWVSNGSLFRRRKQGVATTQDENMILEGAKKHDNSRSLTFPGIAQAMAEQWG